MSLVFACCDERRRATLLGHPVLNGIDDLRVDDLAFPDLDPDDQARYLALPASRRAEILWQRKLTIRFVNPLTPAQAALASEQVQIEGGARVRDIRADVRVAASSEIVLRASAAGDFSRYTLRLVRSTTDDRPPVGFDPVLSKIDFTFKVDCPSDFDCRVAHVCLRQTDQEPVIDYLAKDFASFRRVMLDRIALLAPEWRERNPADLAIALVELIAYRGDHLSYRQDAIATEAYLATARRRTSVRRHARLVDYAMSDGTNARAWVHVEVAADTVIPAGALSFVSGLPELPERIVPGSSDEQAAENSSAAWFEIVGSDPSPSSLPPAEPLFVDHNRLTFYTWGDDRCCLPAGATSATLRGSHSTLVPGMVLVLEEVLGAETGNAADADPTARQAVRLTRVKYLDEGNPYIDPMDGTLITDIEWHADDALRRPLCVSSRTDANAAIDDVCVARGNIVLVDHGKRVGPEDLGAAARIATAISNASSDGCGTALGPCQVDDSREPTRFRPHLAMSPITWTPVVSVAQTSQTGTRRRQLRFDPQASAAAAVAPDAAGARPFLAVTSVLNGVPRSWTAVSDLLGSGPTDLDLVVEVEDFAGASIRFGDNEHGRRPDPGERFEAAYRIGNGRAGNVGAEAIRHVVSADARIVSARNPLPATGGTDPESLARVRRRAPEAFRSQRRAVTPADYEARTTQRAGVQRAAARLRWTGSWFTHFVAVDRTGGKALDDALETDLRAFVEPYRLAGHDLEFDNPIFVSLELALDICVDDGYFRADVRRRLLEVLSSGVLPDGSKGLFHPDRLTFGQSVYLSPLLAAAHAVDGVSSVVARRFGRMGAADGGRALDDGYVKLGSLEVARLDNDPDWPEHGVLRLSLSGGA
ncbi:MAG TPA: putative baseplate assembly protein [Candidatus Limnocylindrales bacterium]|nr:putative baseplate assembly protein [Candidatus Limnocylindrales bacterium]